MRNHSRWIIFFSFLILVNCGSGGGGGSTPVPPPLYSGLTNPAVVTTGNAMDFVSLMFGDIISAPEVVVPAASVASVAMSTLQQKVDPQMLPPAGVSRVPVSWVYYGIISGSESCSGNVNYDYTGAITCDYVNFNNGEGFTLDGRMIIRIFETDDFSYEITHAAIELWTLHFLSTSDDLTMSGILDSVYDIATVTTTDTMNVDGLDETMGKTFRYENLRSVQTCDSPWMPSLCTEDVTGKIYREDAGYVELSLQTPLEYHYMGQFNIDVPDTGGPLLMSGDLQTGIRMVPLNIMDVQIEIDIDADSDYEYSQPYTWFDLAGLVITFEETYGDPVNFDVALAAIPTADKGFVAVGWSNTGATNGVDFQLIKTNAAGSEYINSTMGGPGDQYAMAVRQTVDNGYVIAGYAEAFPNDYGLIYKVDGVGSALWSRPLSSDPASRAYDIIATADDGFLVTGYRYAPPGDSYTGQDLYLVKLNADGTIAWENAYGSTYAEVGYSVIEASTGGYLAVGTSEIDPGTYDQDIYLVRIDTGGTLLWETHFGGTYTQYGFDVVEDADGNFAVSGTTYTQNSGYVYTFHKVDASGSVVAATTFDTTTNNLFRSSITNDGAGGYVVVANDSFDIEMFRLDTAGNVSWQRTYNWSMSMTMCTATSVEQAWDGGFIIGGSAWPGTGKDFYLIKTDAQGYVTAPY